MRHALLADLLGDRGLWTELLGGMACCEIYMTQQQALEHRKGVKRRFRISDVLRTDFSGGGLVNGTIFLRSASLLSSNDDHSHSAGTDRNLIGARHSVEVPVLCFFVEFLSTLFSLVSHRHFNGSLQNCLIPRSCSFVVHRHLKMSQPYDVRLLLGLVSSIADLLRELVVSPPARTFLLVSATAPLRIEDKGRHAFTARLYVPYISAMVVSHPRNTHRCLALASCKRVCYTKFA